MNSDKITYIIVLICLAIIFVCTPLYIEARVNDTQIEEMLEVFTEETVEPALIPTPMHIPNVKLTLPLIHEPIPEITPEPEPIIIEPVIEEPSSDVIMIAKTVWGEARGVESITEQACIVWTILNRVDSDIFPDTISEVVLAPHQFYYSENFPTIDDFDRDLIALTEDVIARWEREKAGETDVGRVLPPEYFYYGALNNRNWFRTDYYDLSTKWYYEWDSPYES